MHNLDKCIRQCPTAMKIGCKANKPNALIVFGNDTLHSQSLRGVEVQEYEGIASLLGMLMHTESKPVILNC